MIRYLFCLLSFYFGMTLMCHSQGLLFKTNKIKIKERPSLQIFSEGNEPMLKNKLEVSFDLSIKDFDVFGYIFLLKDAESKEKFSLTYTYLDGTNSTFKFNTDGKKNHFALNLKNSDLAHKWLHVSIKFDLVHQLTTISIGNYQSIIKGVELNSMFRPMLCFGRYDYILDIPSFAIRNLQILGDATLFSFPLNESSGERVHTTTGEVLGIVTHPIWLINDSYHWKPLFYEFSNSPSGITFDAKRQQLVTFNQDSVLVYKVIERKKKKQAYANKLPVHLQLGTNFINTTDGKLYTYELNNLPMGDPTVAALNLDNYQWEQKGKAALPVQLHHHNGFWNYATQKYIAFGGFGNKRYNNTFLSYDVLRDDWDTINISGDFIAPRFFSGMAVSKDSKRMYIYGGMGNESGDQSVGRNYYHDLYCVDLSTKTIRKIWQGSSAKQMVSVRNMVLTDDEKYIYTLCYSEYLSDSYLQLYRLSIANGEMKALGDSILLHSEEIATNANLYFNPELSEYYCTIQEYDKKGNVATRAYQLNDSPVSLTEVQQYNQSSINNKLWLLMLLLPTVIIIYWIIKKKRNRTASNTNLSEQKNKADIAFALKTNEYSKEENFPIERPNAIYLFGNFTVLDRHGRNITHLFSTRLRQVFVYILLNSSQKGVLSSALNEVFWPDKPDDKVKNLRGVTINQIRKILVDLDGIELIFDKGYFRLILTDCYCDYLRYYTLKENSPSDNEFGSLLMRGKFLKGFEFGALDQFKASVEEFLISYLPLEIERLFALHKYDAVIRFTRVLFEVDPLNETALWYCIIAMNKIGASQEAIMQYSHFVREYKQAMNDEYPLSYQAIVSQKQVNNKY